MSFKLAFRGTEVEVFERGATAGVRSQIRAIEERNQREATSILKQYPQLVSYQNMTDEERAAAATENPELMADLMSHNRIVGDANDFACLAYVRTIVNRHKIDDPELLEAIESPVESEFWQDQDPEALRPVVARFQEAYKL